MSDPLVAAAVRAARDLPASDVSRLATAARGGRLVAVAHVAGLTHPGLRHHVAGLLALALTDEALHRLAGALEAARQVIDEVPAVSAVWTGPSAGGGVRLTSVVVVELLDAALEEVLLVGYAVHDEPAVTAALRRAADRGVRVRLLLERPEDNPGYHGRGGPFAGLRAERLRWPAAARPPGASLHAKVLVVDRQAALVGSANVTDAALDRNLECGMLIRGGPQPAALVAHVDALARAGLLTTLD